MIDIGHNPWLEDVRLLRGRYPGPAPHPEQVLGFALGTRAAHHDEILRYFEELAAALPARVCLTEYGRSWEERRLVYLTVGSEENLCRRASIESRLRQLGDPREQPNNAAGGRRDLPVVCWLGHALHGDELSGSDAAMVLAYRLAAAEDAETRGLREHLLIHIDPVANPDGRERYLAMVRAQASFVPRTDPQDLAHTGVWPWGRTNHYLFDLNRDGIALTQPESRTRVATLRQRSPQLVVEVHEMAADDTFLCAAPAEPINPHVPEHVRDWWQRFATDLGSTFERRGASFYTGGWNEVFYPGYADIWPAYHGAVPVLLEQSTTAGGIVNQPSGRLVTYADCIAALSVAELSILSTAANGREQMLADWSAFRRSAAADEDSIRGYLIRGESQAYRPARLLQILRAHGIELWRSDARPGAYLVRLDQPLARLIRNLLDTWTPLPQRFEDEERQRMQAGAASKLYDVTAWALPLALDVEVETLFQLPEGEWSRLDDPSALTEAPTQIGSDVSELIRGDTLGVSSAPRLAVLAGSGTDPCSYGSIWHLLDTALHYPFTALEFSRLRSVPLARYDVLVVPELENDPRHVEVLASGADLLRAWIELGGTLIGIGSGALALASKACGLARTRLRREIGGLPSPPPRGWMPTGTYVQAEMSRHHWLTCGTPEYLPILFRASDCLCAADDVDVPARFSTMPRLARAGRLWPELAAYIADAACVTHERHGRGQIILFASDPLFRGYSLATQRLFVNAVLFGHSTLQ